MAEMTPMRTDMGKALMAAEADMGTAPEIQQIIDKWQSILMAEDFASTLDPQGGMMHVPAAAIPPNSNLADLFVGFVVEAEMKPFPIDSERSIDGIVITYTPLEQQENPL